VNHSRPTVETPSNGGLSGDGGNRTRAEFPPPSEPFDAPTVLQGWLLALRDLCDQGATAARVTLPGDQGDVSVYYSPGKGGKVITAAGTLDVPVDALDVVALEVADAYREMDAEMAAIHADVSEASLRSLPDDWAPLVASGAIEIEPVASPKSGNERPE
jgi:hypothetical protein